MTWVPFICLGTGIALGKYINFKRFHEIVDKVSTFSLMFLMLNIGLGIGLDTVVMNNLHSIGFRCAVISLSAILFSVILVVVCEKTVLPLKKIDDELLVKNIDLHSSKKNEENTNQEKPRNDLVWIMPISLIAGLFLGVFTRGIIKESLVNTFFVFFLIVLYICVGISQGSNEEVFKYIKILGFRVLWLSVAILIGSVLGGAVSAILLEIPFSTAIIAAGGMSFYSITGTFMTMTYGLEIGTYGFLVNVMREFFTILMMPILVKISLGSPIAGGAAGNMDTMLAPITKCVGVRLGLVTLITGTILTFVVPFLLPVLGMLLK